MRNFRSLPIIKQKSLNRCFPEILDLCRNVETPSYEHASVSVFNHWLTVDEAKDSFDSLSTEKSNEYNRRLHGFCTSIAKSTECYLVKLLGKKKDKVTYREFTSEGAIEQALAPSHHMIGNRFRFILIFPGLESVYFEGWDFTHHFYFKKEESINMLIAIAHEHKLHILK